MPQKLLFGSYFEGAEPGLATAGESADL